VRRDATGDYVIFAALLFYVLTVVGLFVLRRKRPEAERPYRAVGYPVIPAVYVVLCAVVMLDLLVVKFLASYATKPIYVFGGFGMLSFLAAAGAFVWALYYKLRGLKDFVQTPLPLLAVMFTLVGALSLLMGLLAELVIRTYYESQGKRPYLIAEELNARDESREQPLRAAR